MKIGIALLVGYVSLYGHQAAGQSVARLENMRAGTEREAVPLGWQRNTELDPSRGTATTTLVRYGHRLSRRPRATALQLKCYPAYQLEASIVTQEYVHDYRSDELRTEVAIRIDQRPEFTLTASWDGHHTVYFDEYSSRLLFAELAAADDSLFVGISLGDFDPYVAGFDIGGDESDTSMTGFCDRPE